MPLRNEAYIPHEWGFTPPDLLVNGGVRNNEKRPMVSTGNPEV